MNEKTDIVLIQPPGWAVQNPPLGLSLLKSYLAEKDFKAKIMDLNIILYNLRYGIYRDAWEMSNGYYTWERASYVTKMFSVYSNEILDFIYSVLSLKPKYIGFSAHASSFVAAKLLASKFKQLAPEVKIVFGGPHVAHYTDYWENLLSSGNVDAVIFGEGEESLIEFLGTGESHSGQPIRGVAYKDENGQIINGGIRELIPSLDGIPFADFCDFDLKNYVGVNVLPTYFSRGCVNRCIYCTESKYFPKFRSRSGERVFNEIVHQLSRYPNIEYFRMHDSVSNGNIKELEKFCDLLIENKIKIGFNLENAIVRKEMNDSLYKKLKQAGCTLIGYGLETPSKSLLKSVGKRACLSADFDKVVMEGARAKLTIGINMMFGLPGESKEDFQKQLDFIKTHKHYKKYIIINPALNFCYFPEGCIVHSDPDKYNIDMSMGELYWSEKNGENTFLERLEKFEKFCLLAEKLGYRNLFGVTENINKHELLGNYYHRKNEYKLSINHLKNSFDLETKTIELAEDILKLYDQLSLNKDEFYERIVKYKLEFGANYNALLDSINTKQDLLGYIRSSSISNAINRLNTFLEPSRLTKPELTFRNTRQYIKYIVLNLTTRALIATGQSDKRYFITKQLLKNIENKINASFLE